MIKGSNKYNALVEYIQGFYTLETFAQRLRINKTKAIYILYRLRKLGLVETSYGAGKKRLYYISLRNKWNGKSYTEMINENSPIQLASSSPHYVHGRIPSYEELLIYAIKQRDIRYLIASLGLFTKIKNWSRLYKLAKKEELLAQIVALYEVAKKFVRKIKKMPKRFKNNWFRNKSKKFVYMISPLSSDNFQDIEKRWKIYIPLNVSDLEDYKRW